MFNNLVLSNTVKEMRNLCVEMGFLYNNKRNGHEKTFSLFMMISTMIHVPRLLHLGSLILRTKK